jgi:septal ring factor EnvC (AmiA/AmiB activator)
LKYIFYILLSISFLPALGQTRSDLENRREKALEEIEYVDNMLKKTSIEKSQSLGQLNILSKKLNLREEVVRGVREEIILLEKRIELNGLAVELMEEDLKVLIKEYEKAIVHAQRVSKGQPDMAYIFSAKDLNQGYKRLKYLQQVAKFRRREAEIIGELKDRVVDSKLALEHDLETIVNLRAREERQISAIQQEQASKRRIVNSLGKKENQLKQDLKQKKLIADQIEKEIERVIEAERKRRAASDLAPEEKLVGDDFAKNRGRLPWPVERGVITSQFGVHDHPVFKGTKVDNIGIEITSGQQVKARAVFNGKVMSVFGIPGGNMAVIIRHGKYLSVYQNIVNVTVAPGDDIVTKQIIGDVFSEPGDGGKSAVKFMIYEEKVKLDPEVWIVKKE